MADHFFPIIPSKEQIQGWETIVFDQDENLGVVLIQAFQAGADQELEACCEWLVKQFYNSASGDLRDARRPKPPNLKKQALASLSEMSIEPCVINGVDTNASVRAKYDIIRRALEALPDD